MLVSNIIQIKFWTSVCAIINRIEIQERDSRTFLLCFIEKDNVNAFYERKKIEN